MRACTADAGPSEVGRGTRKAAVTRKIGFPRVGWNYGFFIFNLIIIY